MIAQVRLQRITDMFDAKIQALESGISEHMQHQILLEQAHQAHSEDARSDTVCLSVCLSVNLSSSIHLSLRPSVETLTHNSLCKCESLLNNTPGGRAAAHSFTVHMCACLGAVCVCSYLEGLLGLRPSTPSLSGRDLPPASDLPASLVLAPSSTTPAPSGGPPPALPPPQRLLERDMMTPPPPPCPSPPCAACGHVLCGNKIVGIKTSPGYFEIVCASKTCSCKACSMSKSKVCVWCGFFFDNVCIRAPYVCDGVSDRVESRHRGFF
jgi:hypothetical protein